MMKTRLVTLLGALMAACTFGVNTGYAQPGYAQPGMGPGPGYAEPGYVPQGYPTYPPYSAYVQQPGFSDSSEQIVPFTTRYRLDTNQGEGLGWGNGYTSFSGFIPWDFNSANDLFFVDLRGYVTNSTDGGMGDGAGGNFGFGHRHYFESINRYFGLSGWLDLDNGHENDFSAAGISFETVGKWVDFRVNGYIPISDTKKGVFDGVIGDPFFRQHNIMVLRRTIDEVQYGGVDMEIGGPVPYFGSEGISAYVGPYYMASDNGEDAVGVQFRAEANLNEDLQVGLRMTSDKVFGGNIWGTVTMTMPQGSFRDFFSMEWFKQTDVHRKMDRAVQRNYRIPVDTFVKHTREAAIDPSDGNPIFVQHIDTNVASNGDGTFENPFAGINNLINTPDVDIIRVVAGDDSRLVSNGPIALFDNQRLLSSAVNHTFNSAQGVFVLPGFTGGPLPVLSNGDATPSNVITIANNDEVSGFGINGSGIHTGIISQPGGISSTPAGAIKFGAPISFDINRNEFADVTNGVVVTHVGTGQGLLTENTVVGTGAGAGLGLSVTATLASELELAIVDNEVSGFLGEDTNQNDILDFGEDTNLDGLLTPGNGIEVIARLGSEITGGIGGNVVTGNETGLRMISATGATIGTPASPFLILGNEITGNIGENTGMHVTADGGTIIADLTANNISNNNGTQLLGEVRNAGEVIFTLSDNIFDRATVGAGGIGFDVTNGSTLELSLTGGNEFTNGTAEGLRVFADNSDVLVDIFGTTLAEGNLFDNNAGAGVLVSLTGNSTGEFHFDRSTVTNTVDDADVLTQGTGDGIVLTTFDTSSLDDSTIDGSLITDNAGDGIHVVASDSSSITDLTIGNQNGDNGDGALIEDNDGDGVFFRREINANVDRVNIVDITSRNNSFDGIHLQSSGSASDAADFRIEDSNISENNQNGIELRVEADAGLIADITDNDISLNDVDGIRTNEETNAAVDLRFVSGVWTGNRIVSNTQQGIRLESALNGLIVGLDGVDADGKTRGNLIDRNGQNGVLINGAGSAIFTNNTITRNGFSGSATAGHGVDIQGAGSKTLLFQRNVISSNAFDGVEIENSSQGLGFPFVLTFDDNEINTNGARGIDLLNKGDADTTLIATNNVINGNGQEGVYIVNTSATAQTQDGLAPNTDPTDPTHGMAANGAIDALPFLEVVFSDNIVLGNGGDSNLTATGLVFRVGTAGGGYDFQSSGGFASTGAPGVIATVTDNTFGGNFGGDLFIDSFASTPDPATTDGEWTDTEFTVDNYVGDPLARMDLTFIGNTFETGQTAALDVVNIGAFYDNAEPVFKSRDVDQTDPGPFNSGGSRRRNAQRVGFRNSFPPATPAGTPGDFNFPSPFLYPGMGSSTFRLSAGSDNAGFTTNINFGNAIFGELNFGWGTF